MIFQQPKVEIINLNFGDVIATTGSGYTICEKVEGANVSCSQYRPGSNITQAEVCPDFKCDTSSNDMDNANYCLAVPGILLD